jgi:ferritin
MRPLAMPAMSEDLRRRVNEQIANELSASHLYWP